MSGCRGGSVERQHQGLSGGGGGAHLVRHGSRQQQEWATHEAPLDCVKPERLGVEGSA